MLAGVLTGLVLMAAPLQEGAAGTVPVAQDPGEARVDDVIVQGRSVRQQAEAYVTELTAAPGSRRLARWNRKVCVGVAGLDPGYAQFIVDRISVVAASVGLVPGDPGCRPEVLIAFSSDPDAVARQWVDSDLDTFRPSRSGETDLGAEALERFKTSNAPIRWWHVSLPVNAYTGIPVLGGINLINTPSLIQSQTRESLVRTFIIVDADQIGQVSFGSLSDYLALVSLSQVDPKYKVGGLGTVLNLFYDEPAARLSAWDLDFLQSLYKTRNNPIRASTQERHIASELSSRRTQNFTTAEPEFKAQ